MNQYQKEYMEFLRGFLSSSNPSTSSGNKEKQKAVKVVFDCSNGSTGTVLKHLNTKTLKAILINQNPDGNFPAHGPNPLKPGAMKQIQKEVLKNKADLGVIFDADGDRAFFIDDNGRVVDPDIVANILIWHLKAQKVVINETTSNVIKNLSLKANSLQLIRSQNGGYFIKNEMIKNDADFGCERSGHYYFRINNECFYPHAKQKVSLGNQNIKSHYGVGVYMDSGILAAIYVINAISKLPYKLSDFVDLSPVYFRSKELNIKVKSKMENGKRSEEEIRQLFEKIEKYFSSPNSKFSPPAGGLNSSYVDGLRMDFKEGGIASQNLGRKGGLPSRSLGGGWWFNIQLSNTEPLIRLNVEATNKETLAKQTKMLLGLLRKEIKSL